MKIAFIIISFIMVGCQPQIEESQTKKSTFWEISVPQNSQSDEQNEVITNTSPTTISNPIAPVFIPDPVPPVVVVPPPAQKPPVVVVPPPAPKPPVVVVPPPAPKPPATNLAPMINHYMTTTSSRPGHVVAFPIGHSMSGYKKFPLLIFLHGSGECGKGDSTDLKKMEYHGPNSNVKKNTWDTNLPFILISIELPKNSNGGCPGWSMSLIDNVYKYAVTNYNVDTKHTYLTGLSLGGMGTYRAMSDSILNKYFAAFVPIAANGAINSSKCPELKNKGFWAFHGSADKTVSYSSGQKAFNTFVVCSPKFQPNFTTYPGVTHNSWTKTYDNKHGDFNYGADRKS